MKKLYLIDVSSMFFRAFYAIRALSNPQGMPTNAVYGFLSMTVKLMREIKPDYMAFCFDRKEPSFRKEIDVNYKANRSEMPEDLVPQVPYIRKVSEALGVPCFDRLGFEADDIIGTLTAFGRKHALEVVIVSGDKDFGQVVQPFVTLYDTMKDIRYDEAGVLEKWGVEPRKMIDYLSLIGDSSDNIPGVSGIGPVGAQKLLREFDSIEEIYENLDRVANKNIAKKLQEGKADAFLSKKLVRIVCDMDLGIQVDDLKLHPIHRETLSDLLVELDFKNFAKTLLGEVATPQAVPPVILSGEESETPQIGANPVVEITDNFSAPIHEKNLDIPGILSWLEPDLETWGFHTERGLFSIGTAANPPILVIVKNSFRNVPLEPRIMGPWAPAGPATSYPETFFFAPKGWQPPPHSPPKVGGQGGVPKFRGQGGVPKVAGPGGVPKVGGPGGVPKVAGAGGE